MDGTGPRRDSWGVDRSNKTPRLFGVIQLVLLVALVLALAADERARVYAGPLEMASSQSSSSNAAGPAKSQFHHQEYIDGLISAMLDDRLKKSKQNSMKQIKQTLRFGRSDPSMAFTSFDSDGYETSADDADSPLRSGWQDN